MNKKIIKCYFVLCLVLCGCSLAPLYQPPLMNIPYQFKETDLWVQAKPQLAQKNKGAWWEIFADPTLNDLERQVTISNQDLQAAIARLENALALVRFAQADLYPLVRGNFAANRQKVSANFANPATNTRYNDRLLEATLSYEVDLWGRIRNNIKINKNQAKASAADLSSLDLSLHALLANTYFSLRAADESIQALDEIVEAFTKAFKLTQNLFDGGAVPQTDVDAAKTQLENAKTAVLDMRLKRAKFEHAIAILIGKFPSEFSLKVTDQQPKIPQLTAGCPSTLLQRRPDIAASEYQMMAANAQIGVAKAAFFPVVMLLGDGGFESASFKNLFSMPSLIWSLGPVVMQTIFDGGKLAAQLDQAKAIYHETVANYRQTVLSAFQEVEDSLAAQRLLAGETHTQQAALAASHRALLQAFYRYEGGLTTYLDVAVYQNIYLQAKLASIDLYNNRLITCVTLIKALGGGWCE